MMSHNCFNNLSSCVAHNKPVSVLDQAKLPIIELSNFTDTPDENITLADSEAEGLNELANTGCGVFIMKHVNEDGSIVEILFSGTIMPDSTAGIFCANVIQNVFMITNTSGVWKQSCSSIV